MATTSKSIFEEATKSPTPADTTGKGGQESTTNSNDNNTTNAGSPSDGVASNEEKVNTNSNNSNNNVKKNGQKRNDGSRSSGLLSENVQKSIQSIGNNVGKTLQQTIGKSGSSLLSSYDDVLNKVGSTTGIQFAPVKIPLARRRQTLAVLLNSCAFFIAVILNIVAWRYWTGMKFYLYLLYLTYKLLYQTYHKDGGLPIPWLRSLSFWKWFIDYFPVTLHKTCDLSKKEDTSYIFGYHPHGIISMGAWATFACVGQSGFNKLFPNVDVRLLTLRLNFYIPFFDLFITFMGICDASRESINAILNLPDKTSLALVLGGAKESLDAHPGQVVLYLKERKGFVKIALENGATLVPVFSFGENELYSQLDNPQGSLIRRIQDTLQQRLGFAMPIFRGRGVFQYNFGLLPRRIPIHVLFGEPIECPKVPRSEITPDLLNKYHSLYMLKLKELFDNNKQQFYTQGSPPELQFR